MGLISQYFQFYVFCGRAQKKNWKDFVFHTAISEFVYIFFGTYIFRFSENPMWDIQPECELRQVFLYGRQCLRHFESQISILNISYTQRVEFCHASSRDRDYSLAQIQDLH